MNAIFSLFAGPLGVLMRWIYQLIPSYFVALLIFTVLTRLILFPLSIKNQKSQADRARLAPRLERIQKKYAQDRQKAMMKQSIFTRLALRKVVSTLSSTIRFSST